MTRLLTGIALGLIAFAMVFLLPPIGFFFAITAIVTVAAAEFVGIARSWAPGSPLIVLVVLVPLAAAALAGLVPTDGEIGGPAGISLLAAAAFLSVGLGALLLFGRTPAPEVLAAFGALAFGLPYFALGAASFYRLHAADPWLVFLLFTIVGVGDSAAYYVGSRLGRHKMAPVVSPNKSWEGAAAGLVAAGLVGALWSLWRLERVDSELLAVVFVTALAAQVGDLVESLIKRGAGVKDSGNLLPGHGGMLDRIDAHLFAAPVLLFGLWIVGMGRL